MRSLRSSLREIKRWGIHVGKNVLRRTPVWRRLYPRRIHVYGVGPPKTGTNSIARIFNQSFRAGHEFHLEHTINLAFQKLRGEVTEKDLKRRLRRREAWHRLECESNALLIYLAPELADLFPEAKFICTVRSPWAWMRSAMDQHLNVSREDRKEPNARTLRPWLYDVLPRGQYPEKERPLAESRTWNLEAYLDFWDDHYRRALELPRDRVLFLRTENISTSIDRIARFVGIDPSYLSKSNSHANRTQKKHDVLADIDESYVHKLINETCSDTESRLNDCIENKLH